MAESNFLKEVRTATTNVQNFKDFQAKFDYLKKVHQLAEACTSAAGQFSKIHFVIHFHPSHR